MSFKDTPIICSPYKKPGKHYALGDDGQPTGEELPGRRRSMYLVPVAMPRRRAAGQSELALDIEGEQGRVSENHLINEIRQQVDAWRELPPDQWRVTPETQRLLLHWTSAERERKLFFCQREAVETLIYLTEVEPKRFRKALEEANAEANPGLFRMACKMATGSGKTTVMGMLIAWHAVNRARRPGSKIYSDAFLVVTPGITIRDRLRVLLPQDANNIYEALDLVPREFMDAVKRAKIIITNFHAFQLRSTETVPALDRKIIAGRERNPDSLFVQTEGAMVADVAPELMNRRGIIVLNDEAHHCYEERQRSEQEEKLDADEKDETERSRKAARVWINGLKAVNRVLGRGSRDPGISAVYDLSATPFHLRGSGYDEGTLFKWVVSDFSLLDAIESGIVKVPRLPVSDDAIYGDMPKYRRLYDELKGRKALPRKGAKKQGAMDPEKIDALLEGALRVLYNHYEGERAKWRDAKLDREPVFIVVANNTATSKLIFDWIAGYERTEGEGDKAQTRIVSGKLPLFSNVTENGQWSHRPRTILIDSEQLESGELTDDFRKAAAREIEEFKRELRQREGEAAAEKLTDADLLREAMNTVGKPGRLGGDLRCVVSVSMLTEGWDANTVTHVLGVRAFRAALLSEQVVGRALRRVSYDPDPQTGLFRPEYADVLGVPYIFATEGKSTVIVPANTTRVKAIPERADREVVFPNVEGYRVVYPRERLAPQFTSDSRLTLTPDDVPTQTENAPLLGEPTFLNFDSERKYRDRSVAYQIAGYTLRQFFRDEDGSVQVWRYPDLVRITEAWMAEYLICKGGVPKQILRWPSLAQRAAEKIQRACIPARAGDESIRPMLNAYNPAGSTRYVAFETAKTKLLTTREDRCQVNYVVADADWELGFAERIEQMPEVHAYVKNHNLHFEVPYLHNGQPHVYRPDYIVRIEDGHGPDDLLNLVVEIKGRREEGAATKAETMRKLWLPAVNNSKKFGRWDFIEFVSEPYDVAADIRAHLSQRKAA